MRARVDPSPALLQLADRQAGVVSTAQASGLGLSRRSIARLLESRRWRAITRGLYLVHDQPVPWAAWAWGGVLLGGDRARLGGMAALHLYGLAPEPREIQVLVPPHQQRRSRAPWRFLREEPGLRSPGSPGEPPRLSIEEAVLDQSEDCDEGELVDLITRVVQNRRTTAKRLARCAAGRPRLRHRRLLRQLLGDVAEGAESPLELRYLRDVERSHGLPRGERQRRSAYGNIRHDVRYGRYATVVELDGRLGHSGTDRFRDMDRDNLGLVAGTATLRYGWRDTVDRPCSMAHQVASVLIQRGWTGVPDRCGRCRQVPLRDLL